MTELPIRAIWSGSSLIRNLAVNRPAAGSPDPVSFTTKPYRSHGEPKLYLQAIVSKSVVVCRSF